MGIAQRKGKISIEEYIKIEAEENVKYEYHDGEIFAMAGGTIRHTFITGYVYRAIANALDEKNQNCEALNGEAKIYIKAENRFLYPDTSVVCGDLEESKKGRGICNPTLIVEVLSKSTEGYDRAGKFSKYRKISSLREYVLVAQNEALVEVFYKPPHTDLWRITSFEGLDVSIQLESIGVSIPMSQFYRNILDRNFKD